MDLIGLDAALFTAVVVAVLWLVRVRAVQRLALLAANAAFLYLFDPLAPLVFLATSLLGYGAARLAAGGAPRAHRAVVWLAAAPLLVPLFLPKLKALTGEAGGEVGNVLGSRLVLFVGASYFTLRALHFVIEARRRGECLLGLLDFLVYNSFFPTIVAGPIERADHFLLTYDKLGRPSFDDLAAGVTRIFFGLLKKVVLGGIALRWAAPIGQFAVAGDLSFSEAWVALYAICLYAYFDFAGYSDLAIGVSRLMGIRLAENFDNPYLRPSIAEFWKGWHLSLSFWIRDYLFVPMCGRSQSKVRPHAAALASMTLCGLWHAPALGWALWGFFHGLGLSVHQAWTLYMRKRFKLKKALSRSKLFRTVCVIATFHFVAFTWTWISIDASRVGPTLRYLRILAGFG